MSKFLLILGPSGVGKSTVIQELIKRDKRFNYISPYITRPLRKEEKDKISVSDLEIDDMQSRGEILVVNSLYGIKYATPKMPIVNALQNGLFPVLDWPISRISIMTDAFLGKLYSVYISPPSIEVLAQRLAKDGRDISGSRFENAQRELQEYWSKKYVGLYDVEIVSEINNIKYVVDFIYQSYLESFI